MSMYQYEKLGADISVRLERIRNDMREHHRRFLKSPEDETLINDLRILLDAVDRGILAINRT